MNTKTASSQRGDAGLLDLLAILVAVAIVVVIGFAFISRPRRSTAPRIHCVNNLKQVGLAFRLWSGDNGDRLPMQVSTNDGGTMEFVASGTVFPHLAVMSNELGTPKILACPADQSRKPATNFSGISDINISYFVVPEADETRPEMWLSGDRNLATNNIPIKRGLFTMQTNRVMSWTAQLHNHKGNLAFADGSVQQLADSALRRSAFDVLTNYQAITNASFRLAIP